jgi:hypothetical protein
MARAITQDDDAATRFWSTRILAGFVAGTQVRIPLAVFHSAQLRRDLESELAARGHSPCWDRAMPSLDDVGRLERVVPVEPVLKPASVDDGWD